jgi:hypothetical protein
MYIKNNIFCPYQMYFTSQALSARHSTADVAVLCAQVAEKGTHL